MAIREIVEVPDPRLKLVSEPVAAFDDTLRTLVADMYDTMYDAHGIGLAAIQVGEPVRVLVIDLQEPDEDAEPENCDDHGCGHDHRPTKKNPLTFINPRIVEVSEETSTYQEGCLSIPEIYGEVERPARCRVRWHDLDGAEHEQELDGLLATCLQHEMDHLNGILFLDHLSRLKRNMALKKLDKLRKAA